MIINNTNQDIIKELEDKIKLLELQKKELFNLAINFFEDEHGVDLQYTEKLYSKYFNN